MSELKKGLDTAASVVDKGLDEGVGLAKRVLSRAVGMAAAVVAAPAAFVVGSIVDNQTDWIHEVTAWVASLF